MEPGELQRGWAGTPAAGEQVFTIYSERGAAKQWNFFLLSSFDATNRKWPVIDAQFCHMNEGSSNTSQTWLCIRNTWVGLLNGGWRGPAPRVSAWVGRQVFRQGWRSCLEEQCYDGGGGVGRSVQGRAILHGSGFNQRNVQTGTKRHFLVISLSLSNPLPEQKCYFIQEKKLH